MSEGRNRALTLVPQHPVTGKDAARAWRAAGRTLLLIDRNGSMSPFHGPADLVTDAIRNAGQADVTLAYFHDLPGSCRDRSVLDHAPFGATLDAVLDRIGPLRDGRVYDDPGLTVPRSLGDLLARLAPGTGVLVISDAGAARRVFDLARLQDTIALLKAVHAAGGKTAWVNPAPAGWWGRTTAWAIARHVPMSQLTPGGLAAAAAALREATPVEAPLTGPAARARTGQAASPLPAPDPVPLACHAALPVAVDAALVNLMRVNFLAGPPASLPYEAEPGLLLSPLFREIGEGLFEPAPGQRTRLLAMLREDYGPGRVRQVAELLSQYTERNPAWPGNPVLQASQRVTALSFLDPDAAWTWLRDSEAGRRPERLTPEWHAAMRRQLAEAGIQAPGSGARQAR